MLSSSIILNLFAIIYFILLAPIVFLVEPYKEEYAFYNVLDCVQYLWLAIFCSSIEFVNLSGLFYMLCTYFVILCVSTLPLIRESVDSLCRDGADTPIKS